MSTDRWIFGFKHTGSRALSSRVREEARKLAGRHNVTRYTRGVMAVLAGIVGLAGIAIVTDGRWWGWIVIVAGTVGFFWILSLASASEHLALLLRRTARIGEIDTFSRVGANVKVRVAYRVPHSEEVEAPANPYWESEERFEEAMIADFGCSPSIIETPKDDDVIVLAESRWVKRDHRISVIDIGK